MAPVIERRQEDPTPALSAGERPEPGSEAARALGCWCSPPRRGGERWIALGCPVHSLRRVRGDDF